MKTTIVSLACLLVGVGIGWYFGYTMSNAQEAKDLVGVLETQKTDAAAAANFAVDAIQSIDSGQTKKAEQFLSFPIADYYVDFRYDSSTNESLVAEVAFTHRLACTDKPNSCCSDFEWIGYPMGAKIKIIQNVPLPKFNIGLIF